MLFFGVLLELGNGAFCFGLPDQVVQRSDKIRRRHIGRIWVRTRRLGRRIVVVVDIDLLIIADDIIAQAYVAAGMHARASLDGVFLVILIIGCRAGITYDHIAACVNLRALVNYVFYPQLMLLVGLQMLFQLLHKLLIGH